MSDLNVPLADDASQTSRSSLSGSLLDRIRAQRERETANNNANSLSQPEPVNAPSYFPAPEATIQVPQGQSAGWGMNFNIPSLGLVGAGGQSDEAATALLQDENQQEEGEGYSMSRYFQTFVLDIYGGFRSLHPVAQVVLVVFLTIVMFKLLLGI